MTHGQRSGWGHAAFRRLLSREVRWTAAMFLCGFAVSGFGYFVWPAPDARQGASESPGEFVPSLFIASGWGFVVPEDYHDPALVPFLRRQDSHFEPATLPADLAVTPPYSWDQRHRYLYYAAALIWMLFGISWPAMKLLPILLYASMWPLLFRIFRLAGGRKVSAAFTALFMLNPAVVDLHWTVRDFSKAPFFLGVMLVIGWMLQHRMNATRLMTLALIAGTAAGIGSGFRRDLVMAVLPALVAIAVAPRLVTGFPWRVRAASVALLLGAFAIAGAPIHAAYTGMGDPHDAIMGFSRPVDAGLGVKQADYQHMGLQSDYQIHATMMSAARRVDGRIQARQLNPGQISEAGMGLARWLVLTYPADLVTRALASARWALSGGMPLDAFPVWWGTLVGIVLPAVTLFIVASNSVRRGLALFLVCAPLFGYIALQFGWRHGFHLTFAPLWCLAFLHTQWSGFRRYRAVRRREPDWTGNPPAWLRLDGLLRGCLVLGIAAGLLLTPLALARAVQKHQVNALLEQYENAARTPVPAHPRPIGAGWTLLALDPNAPEPDVPYNTVDWPFREAYLVAVFAPGDTAVEGVIKYESEEDALDLSFSFWIPATPGAAEPIQYYFPVFENWHMDQGAWNRFSGIVLHAHDTGRFLGLYRLEYPEAISFWSLYRIQGDGRDFARARRIALLRGEPRERLAPDIALPTWLLGVDRSMGQYSGIDPVENALPRVRAALEADPQDASLWLWLGNILEHTGGLEDAEDAYARALEIVPRHFVAYKYLEDLYTRTRTTQERLDLWLELASRYPQSVYPYLLYSRTLMEEGGLDAAADAARKAVAVSPWRREPYDLLATILKTPGAGLDARETWLQLVEDHPDAAPAWRYLGEDYRRAGDDLDAALDALAHALDLDPYDHQARLNYAYTLVTRGAYEEAMEQFEVFQRNGGGAGFAYIGMASTRRAAGDLDAARAFTRQAHEAGAQLPHHLRTLLD